MQQVHNASNRCLPIHVARVCQVISSRLQCFSEQQLVISILGSVYCNVELVFKELVMCGAWRTITQTWYSSGLYNHIEHNK